MEYYRIIQETDKRIAARWFISAGGTVIFRGNLKECKEWLDDKSYTVLSTKKMKEILK